MVTCEKCKHWGKPVPREFLRTCEHPNMSRNKMDDRAPKNATYTVCCLIETGPKYGCVLGEVE